MEVVSEMSKWKKLKDFTCLCGADLWDVYNNAVCNEGCDEFDRDDECPDCGRQIEISVTFTRKVTLKAYRPKPEATCEHCGKPAEYHPDMILCSGCESKLAALEPEPIYDCTTGRAVPGHPGLA